MDIETAQLVLIGITSLGAIVWVVALNFLSRSARREPPTDSLVFGDEVPADSLLGGTEVDGTPRELAARTATVLVQGNQSSLGPIRILEKADDRIVFERPDTGIANRSPGYWFRRVELRFSPVSPARTRVEWLVEPAKLRWLLQAGIVVQLAGLLVLVIGYMVLNTHVASSPDPAVRWQTFQMLQVTHFLWPPFLFGGLYRKGMRAVPAQLEALVNNLPFLKS